jgi:WD40 repeat protein
LVAGSQEGNLVLYMQQPLKSLWSIDKAHNGAVTSLLFTKNSEKIVSAGEDGEVKVWDFHRGELLKLLCTFEQKIKTLRWLEDEKYMVITLEESIVTFCMESLVVVSTIDIASSSKSRAILSSLAKERVAIHTPLHGLELFDIKSTKCTKSFTKSVYGNQTLKHLQFGCGDRAFVQQPPLEISHDSRYVVSALSTQQIALWDMRSVELVSRLGNADKFVSAVTITPDNRYIFSASFNYVDEYISEPSIEIYDVESSELLYVFEIDKKDTTVLLLRITPDGRYLIALLLGGLVMKWDIEKLELVESRGISCHEYDIYAPTISWDGSLLMYALDRESSSWSRTIGSIEIVDMVSGNRIEKIEYKITLESIAFLTIEISKDNRYVSLYADNLKLFCWDRVEKIFIYDSKVHHLNNEYNTTMIRSILAPNRNYRVNIYDDEKLGLSVWSMDEATELYRLFVAEKSSSLIIDVEEQEIMVDGEDEVLITSFSSPDEKLQLE